jgi:hypothetical protein
MTMYLVDTPIEVAKARARIGLATGLINRNSRVYKLNPATNTVEDVTGDSLWDQRPLTYQGPGHGWPDAMPQTLLSEDGTEAALPLETEHEAEFEKLDKPGGGKRKKQDLFTEARLTPKMSEALALKRQPKIDALEAAAGIRSGA